MMPSDNENHDVLSSSKRGYYSGFVSRTLAYLIDAVIIGLTISIVYWIFSKIVFPVVPIDISSCPPLTTSLTAISCNVFRWLLNLFMIGFTPVYILFFWLLAGQTPGKAILGVRVQRLDGGRMTLLTGLIRLAGYFLCFLSMGIGFLWIILDDRRQGWHDKLAGTCVVYKWEARQNERFLERVGLRLFRRRD